MLGSYIFYYSYWSKYQVDMIPISVKSTESYSEILFVCNIVKEVLPIGVI